MFVYEREMKARGDLTAHLPVGSCGCSPPTHTHTYTHQSVPETSAETLYSAASRDFFLYKTSVVTPNPLQLY